MASKANLTLIGRALLLGYTNGDDAKYNAILDYLCGLGGFREVAGQYGISASALHGYVDDYRRLCVRFIEMEGLSPHDLVRAVDDDTPGYVRPDHRAAIETAERAA